MNAFESLQHEAWYQPSRICCLQSRDQPLTIGKRNFRLWLGLQLRTADKLCCVLCRFVFEDSFWRHGWIAAKSRIRAPMRWSGYCDCVVELLNCGHEYYRCSRFLFCCRFLNYWRSRAVKVAVSVYFLVYFPYRIGFWALAMELFMRFISKALLVIDGFILAVNFYLRLPFSKGIKQDKTFRTRILRTLEWPWNRYSHVVWGILQTLRADSCDPLPW